MTDRRMTTDDRERVAEAICDNIDISFYKWGRLDPESYGTIMKTADAVLSIARASAPAGAVPADAPMPFPHDRRLAEPDMTVEQVRQWIEACNHEPARRVLRTYLFFRNEFPHTAAAPEGEPSILADEGTK